MENRQPLTQSAKAASLMSQAVPLLRQLKLKDLLQLGLMKAQKIQSL